MALDMRQLERWQRAANRALAADLPSQLRQRGSSILVPSKSEDGKTYHVQFTGGLVGQCDCTAALNGNSICAHRAAVAVRLYERQSGARVLSVKVAGMRQMEEYLRA